MGDLADQYWIAPVLRDDVVFNFVSLTGTAHSRTFYLHANDPWEVTPVGLFPDWFQWRKLMRNPAFSGATSDRMTALQFPTSQDGREGWTGEMRHDEIAGWATIAASRGGQSMVDALVAKGDRLTCTTQAAELNELRRSNEELRLWAGRRSLRAADSLARIAYRLPILRRLARRAR